MVATCISQDPPTPILLIPRGGGEGGQVKRSRGQNRGHLAAVLPDCEQELVKMVATHLALLILATPALAFYPFHNWFGGNFTPFFISQAGSFFFYIFPLQGRQSLKR